MLLARLQFFYMKSTKENNGLENKEGVVKLEVAYGLEKDTARVKNTIKRLPWYKEQGYDVASIIKRFPAGILESSIEEEVDTAVGAEYSAVEYEKFKEFIEEKWEEFALKLDVLKTASSLELRDSYTIVLTKYGMGGSYNAEKGEAIINLSSGSKERLIGIIFHEIVHMTIEHLIQKYQIKHWQKERLVNLMMGRYFPELENRQSMKEDVTAVDEAFNKFFPDFEAIAVAIKAKNDDT